jgi:hypothetical protein
MNKGLARFPPFESCFARMYSLNSSFADVCTLYRKTQLHTDYILAQMFNCGAASDADTVTSKSAELGMGTQRDRRVTLRQTYSLHLLMPIGFHNATLLINTQTILRNNEYAS